MSWCLSRSRQPNTRSPLQQRRGLRQPGLRAVRIAGLELLLGEVLQRGDGDVRGSLALPDLERLVVMVERLRPGAQVTQYPAGEVDRPAGEPRHLAPLHLGGVPGERGQRLGRAAGQRIRVPGEQQRMQGRRRMLHSDLPAGRRAQQRQRLGDPALMGPQHPQPPGGGHPVRPLGQRERLTEQQLGLGQIARGVLGAAADRQAPGPGRRVRRGERAVLGELGGLGEIAAEIRRPGADLQRGRAGGRGPLDVLQRLGVPPAQGADPGPGQPPVLIGMQPQRVVQQRLGRRVIEAFRGLGRRVAERAGGQHQVTAQPRVIGDGQRVGARAAGRARGRPAGAAARPVPRSRSPPAPPGPAHAGTGRSRRLRPGTAGRRPARRRRAASMAGRPSTAASRSTSSSGPMTAAVRSSSPAAPSSSHRADTDSTSEAGSSARPPAGPARSGTAGAPSTARTAHRPGPARPARPPRPGRARRDG